MRFNSLWVQFIFRELNWVSMSKIPSPTIQMESWARCLGGRIFPGPEEFVYSFLVYFGIVQIWPMYHSLDKRVWFTIFFLPLKESLTLFQIWIFYYTFTYFVTFGVMENRVTKVHSKYFNGNWVEAWIFKKFIFELDASSYIFKITWILFRQAISLKKMVVSSAKYIILIVRSPICIHLIFLTIMKLARTSAVIMHKSIENVSWKTFLLA